MAPTKKRARPRDRAAAAASRPNSTPSTDTTASPLAPSQNKKAKRADRHAALLHKISASAPGKIKRRRRKPATQLPSMDTMLDALPDLDWEGFSSADEAAGSNGAEAGKMRMKTLKSKRGAGKARAKLEKTETARMGKNMAAMAGAQGTGADKWAALRGFIGRTMESSALFKMEESASADAAMKV